MNRRTIILTVVFMAFFSDLFGQNQVEVPFSTTDKNLTVWTGGQFESIFIKGVNLGVGLPGTQVWDLAASRSDYARWFPMMSAAGFNSIRVFTLHFPHFYEELAKYNQNNPDRPLYLIQGIWLEEEIPGYMDNLYQFTEIFDQEIIENVRAIHGGMRIMPGNGQFRIQGNGFIDSIELYTIDGRLVHKQSVNDSHTVITRTDLATGIYFVRAHMGDQISVLRFTILR